LSLFKEDNNEHRERILREIKTLKLASSCMEQRANDFANRLAKYEVLVEARAKAMDEHRVKHQDVATQNHASRIILHCITAQHRRKEEDMVSTAARFEELIEKYEHTMTAIKGMNE
jgi:predicted  nucleic acid-binding Zn-ribbon protein